MQQLPRAAEQSLALRAAELVRRHGADKTVAGGAGVTLLDLLTADSQRRGLRPHPRHHAPDRAVVQGSFLHDGRPRRRPIADHSVLRAGRLAIGLLVVFQVTAGKVQESRAGVALIGEYESRDNR